MHHKLKRMKVLLVPSSAPTHLQADVQHTSSYLINDSIVIDAGSIGFFGSPQDQARIKHVLITHAHLDHIASLPMLLENAYDHTGDCLTLHGSQAVIECLQRDIFNDRVWPDFIKLSQTQSPFLKINVLQERQTLMLEGLRITSIPVNHLVPTTGFLIEDAASAIVIASDTGPTQEIWDKARGVAQLKAVFLEAAFPNRMEALAHAARHLTPSLFLQEARKLERTVKYIAVHLKPRFRDEIVNELMALGLPNLEIGRFDVEYSFA